MPLYRLFTRALLPLALLLAASPAAACLPPPPGTPEPPPVPRGQLVHTMVLTATDIVSGRVMRRLSRDDRYRFRVERVFKGDLRPGAILTASQGPGLDPPMCYGMIPPWPLPPGARGVIFFKGDPEINFIANSDMEIAFAAGLLQRPPPTKSR